MSNDSSGAAPKSKGPNVVMLVAVSAVVIAVGYLLFVLAGGESILPSGPNLTPVTVKVLFNGKPLEEAMLMTQPGEGGRGTIGFKTDKPGYYALMTDVEGVYTPGIAPGKHKVTIEKRHSDGPSFGTPPLLTPEEYSTFGKTPLTLSIKRGRDKEITLEMEGEALETVKARLGGGAPRAAPTPPGDNQRGGGGAGGRGGGRGGRGGDEAGDGESSDETAEVKKEEEEEEEEEKEKE